MRSLRWFVFPALAAILGVVPPAGPGSEVPGPGTGPAAAPFAGAPADPGPLGFARDPHYHGGRIVFSFRGDLWVVREDGSDPRQLTRHQGRDQSPRYSPDGRWIAFTSNRTGNSDVFVMPAEGGEPRQLTFHTGGDDVVTWTPDGSRVVFASNRGPLMWETQLYSVSVQGGLPAALPVGASVTGTFSPDGRYLAFNRKRYPDPKRHYQGSAAAAVWVADLELARQDGAGAFRRLTNTRLEEYRSHAHDAFPMYGADGWIYFKSERDGIFNLWRVRPGGGQPEQVTRHQRGGVRFPSVSPDGRTIVYSNEFDLWLYRVGEGAPRRVPAELGWVLRTNLVEYVSAQDRADGFAPSPRGDYLAVGFRGEVFIVPSEEGVGEIGRVTESAWRQHGALYSPDGRYLAYLSDESMEEEVWLYEVATGEGRKLTGQASRKSLELWSPGSETVWFTADNAIYAADLASGGTRRVAHNAAGGYHPTQVAPDGRWLVVHGSDDFQNMEVYLLDSESGREHNATDHPARDSDGLLTPDGRRLLFLSNRDGGRAHLFSVELSLPTEDPDDPLVRERRQRADEAGGRREEPAPEGAGAAAPFQLDFDLADIGRRAVQLTRGSDAVAGYFLSRDGRTIYYVSGPGASRALHAMDLDGKNPRKIADGPFQDLRLSGDGRTIFFREGDGIFRMPLANRTKSQVRFRLAFAVDRREEWRQMFDEFYRYWKYNYVEEDMWGLDWDAVRARYEPLVERIGETEDFYELAGEMLHEVPSSHSGIRPPAPGTGPEPPYRTRFPGFELEPGDDGLRVSYIYREGPADRVWLELEEGDYVLALNGTPVGPRDNYWKLLNGLVNEYVTVTAADSPGGRNRRDLRIRTVTNLSDIRYEDWVARNREFADRESDGRIAYLHIRSMNQASLDRLQQELDQYFHKQGMIIDVRYNGGGNIDQQLMDVLSRRPYQYTWTRTGSPLWGRRPHQIIYGPQVMMANWRSGSNAEMVPHAFRHLELGTLVGTPTNGAVVSARWLPFLDGGAVRVPAVRVVSYDPEQPHNWGFNLENYGVPPDLWVRNTPGDELRGFDRELKAAVDEALRLLATGRWQYGQGRPGG